MNKSMVVYNISNKNNITSIVVLGDCSKCLKNLPQVLTTVLTQIHTLKGLKIHTVISLRISVLLTPGPVFTKGISQGLGLKLRLLSQVSAQKLLKPLS